MMYRRSLFGLAVLVLSGSAALAQSEALRRKWTIVSIKTDWKVVYPFERK